MILRTLLLIAGLLVCFNVGAFAQEVTVDGINYLLKSSDKTAKVSTNTQCTGFVSISEKIMYGDESYVVTEIGDSAFLGCSELMDVYIPNSVISIGSSAFQDCSSLQWIFIPNSVQIIWISAFQGCSSLTNIDLPNTVTTIREGAFQGCSSLTNIDIPNTITTIEYATFSGCYSLTNIDIPNSVQTIDSNAFSGCSGLTNIDIPNSVQTIESGAFFRCSGLTSLLIPKSVTTIGNFAFGECTGLTSVGIPNSVTEIGDNSFYGCTNVITLYLDMKSIPYIFQNRGNLTNVTLGESVQTIEGGAFYYCGDLTDVTFFGNSVQSIGNKAFYHCSSLTHIAIPDSVTTIGTSAFEDCTNLTDVNLSKYLQIIGSCAFESCTSLKSIVILDSVKFIGKAAFKDCSSLTNLTIGKAVAKIEGAGFLNCLNLKEIYSLNPTPPSIVPVDEYTSPFSSYDATLYVPKGSLQSYKAAPIWKLFANIREIGTTGNECTVTVPANVEHGTLVVMNGTEALVAGENEVEANTKLTITATPDEGYVLESLTVNGADFTSGNTYTVTENTNIAVSFVKAPAKKYMMRWNIEGDGEGTITVTDSNQNSYAAETPVVEGTKLTVTFKPAEHSLLKEAKINDKSILDQLQNNSYTFIVTEDFMITALYAAIYEVTLNKESVTLKATESFQLEATVSPASTTDKTIRWSSTNEEVANVDANGKVTALSVGNATITATCGEVSAQCAVQVVPTPAAQVTLNKESVTLKATESFQLEATVSPVSTTDKTILWSSTNEEVAKVDANGKVTALSVGQATITATCGEVSAQCMVQVEPVLPTDIDLEPEQLELNLYETFQLVATVSPANVTDASVMWSSSRPDVVQVDDQGLVTALSVGQATITATDMEGHSATCEVKVSDDLSIEVLESLPAGKVLIFNLKGILQTAKFKDLPRGWYIVNGRKVRKP